MEHLQLQKSKTIIIYMSKPARGLMTMSTISTFFVGVTRVLVCMGGRETFLTASLGLVADFGVAGGVLFR